MSPLHAWAVVVGLGLGLGLWTLVALMPGVGARRLTHRVAPYVLDVSAEARSLHGRRVGEPASVLVGIASPVIDRARALLSNLLGGDAAVERRLRQAGSRLTIVELRARQLAWAAAGAGVGLVAALMSGQSLAVPPIAAVTFASAAAVGGLLLPEQVLARRAKARLARIAAELPTVLEFLSLALSAGETTRDALRRVSEVGSGELSRELGRVMTDVDIGVPLTEALTECAASLDLPALSRAIEQLVTAIERGSPLVDVLRAQAQDSREDAKRALLESAGRKEVAMLVPLVFMILPVTIVFATFPATLVLQVGF